MATDSLDSVLPTAQAAAPAPTEAPTAVTVRPLAFSPLDGPPAGRGPAAASAPLDILLDIEVPIIVELGHTEMSIEELLALKPGAVVELDKIASEPVELLIRDHVVARGEVIVVDDNFGIRITQIVDPADRVKNLR
jgi:flagellar motor switch protein FliN/FliY